MGNPSQIGAILEVLRSLDTPRLISRSSVAFNQSVLIWGMFLRSSTQNTTQKQNPFLVVLSQQSIRKERKETLTFTSLTFLFFWSLLLNYLFLLVYLLWNQSPISMDTRYIHEAPNIPQLLSITLKHLNGCPLTVGHPLFLGVSGYLTDFQSLVWVVWIGRGRNRDRRQPQSQNPIHFPSFFRALLLERQN